MAVRDDRDWRTLRRCNEPLLLSIPHAGTLLPPQVSAELASPWLARKDTDWYVDRLCEFAVDCAATVVRTLLSRSVIDADRDPSGKSLYPGLATTELCPTETFDGERLYVAGGEPDDAEIAARRCAYFDPYHAVLATQIERLRARHGRIVLLDADSIRSRVPRLFDGELPAFNLGTNSGRSCAQELVHELESVCDLSGLSRVTDGRFKGGYITRHYGDRARGIHAVQIGLSMAAYLQEPGAAPDTTNWPPAYVPERAAPVRRTLENLFERCIAFARRSWQAAADTQGDGQARLTPAARRFRGAGQARASLSIAEARHPRSNRIG